MRETEAYRDNLARLDKALPGKELLTRTDVSRALGISKDAVTRLLKGKLVCGKYISKATLARLLS